MNNGLNLLTVPQGPQRMVKGAIVILAVSVDLLRKQGRRWDPPGGPAAERPCAARPFRDGSRLLLVRS
jgi:hypothetical protein